MISDSLVLARRTVTKMVRTPEQFIDVTLQPILMTTVFVFIFGGAIAGNTTTYVEFALPGILVQTIMFTAMTIGTNLNTDLKNGVFDRFRSLPIARSAPLVGAALGDIVRHSIVIIVTFAYGALIGFRVHTSIWHFLAAVLLMLLFAVSLCWLSVFVGMIARSSGAVQGLSFLVTFPLTFASSTFVPATTLPDWMQGFVAINPVTHVTNAMRGLLIGPSALSDGATVGGEVLWVFGACVVLFGVFFPLAMWAYRKKI